MDIYIYICVCVFSKKKVSWAGKGTSDMINKKLKIMVGSPMVTSEGQLAVTCAWLQ